MKLCVVIFAVCASSALAGDNVFTPPAGCTGFLTVQQANCKVAQYWTCEKDPDGIQWRADIGQTSVTYLGKIDAEAQWLESYDFSPSRQTNLQQPASDPANLTELLATGVDSYDFIIVDAKTQQRTRVVGYDRIVEYNVTVDGEPLHRTEFSARFVNPGSNTALLNVSGREYVSAKHRRFFGGPRTREMGDRKVVVDSSPIEFIYPGEDGFFASTPLYGCSLEMASLSAALKGPKP